MNQTNQARRLTRSRDDRFIGGVAAGIARYFNLDPVLIRAAFVISVAFGGIGVLAYLVLLALVPIDGDPDEPALSPTGGKRIWVIAGTVALGLIALVSIGVNGFGGWLFGFGPGPLFGVMVWILALGGVFWLVREATRDDDAESGAFGRAPAPPAPPAPPTPPAPPATTGDDPTEVLDDEAGNPPTAVTATMASSPSQNAPTTPLAPPPEGPGQRNPTDDGISTIGRIMTFFAIGISALIVFSILGILSAGATAIFGAIPMAALVILLGVGLVVAAVNNRRQLAIWLLAAALVIAVPMAAISIADLRIEGSYGDTTEEPRLAGDIPDDGYQMAAGAMTIDLRRYPFKRNDTVDLPVESGMGVTRVIVPDGVCVSGNVKGKAGLADVRGVEASGVGVDRAFSRGSGDSPELNLDAEFKLGYFEVVDATDWQKYGPRDPDHGPWDDNWDRGPSSPTSQAAARKRALAACMPAPKKDRTSKKGDSSSK
ncbi:MAG TPA: PspC domain-containing protein [Solirubrobacterales bacterium]|nr:PspC domain-containing protein [Solirubrobacterales bacterium]